MRKEVFYVFVCGVLLCWNVGGCSTPLPLGGTEQACTTCGQEVIADAGSGNTDAGSSETIFRDLTVKQSYELTQQKPELIVVDIRTAEEFNRGHIQGSLNIDFYGSDFRSRIDQLDKSKAYLVYCASGRRSANSMPAFKELGFVEVYNMLGGFIDWSADGYPSAP